MQKPLTEKVETKESIKFSASIISFNEEKNIARCIESLLPVTDDIVVLDSYSTDKTKDICLKYPVNFQQQKFEGHIQQKNAAIALTKHDKIISLDADEALSEELQSSITALKTDWKYDGYYARRANYYCGQYIKWSGWNPDKKLRVFDKNKAYWAGINPHDTIVFKEENVKTKLLKGPILHWVHQTYDQHSLKVHEFSSIAANAYFELGKKSSISKIILRSSWAFIKAYIIRLGILDGLNGYVISRLSAQTTFLKYLKLRQLIKNSKKDSQQ